ncbi:AAA domain-containing protein [Candidatus Bathyarchaeota archaeon]|nr:AAA domain-containing protein [Candidatus Bathyarchaeota archaeon]
MQEKVKAIQRRYKIIGREEELERALAAVSSNKHILFEGAVGVGKTVIAMALANYVNRRFHRVDGDERYTEHKLTGWFDPAMVIAKGYSRETFILGPLTQAMTEGSFLFINELNRMPEGTQNVLLPAMDERQIIIPKIGSIKAKPGFLIIATQNPEEFVGTSRLSEALEDRFVWIRLDYQSEIEEQKIVQKETGCKNEGIISIAVKIARKTREDSDIRQGASVRGAMDITELVQRLSGSLTLDPDVWIRAAIMALAKKIDLQDQTTQKLEDVVKRIVTSVLSEYTRGGGRQATSRPADTTQREKRKKKKSFHLSKEVKGALDAGNLSKAIYLLQQNPQSISEMLLEENLFEAMIKAAEHSEPKWPVLHLLFMTQTSLDPTRRRIARKILSRTIVRMAAQIVGRGIGPTEYVNVPFQPGLEEFDLEKTLENALGKDFLDYQDIVCVERRRKKRAFSLILDASNSMQMEKIVIAALAVGVFAYRFLEDHYSVITFKDQAQLVKSIKDRPDMEKLIDKMLSIQPGGLTNIEKALRKGLEELEKFRKLESAGILITDGWVTKGGDPIRIAEKYQRLHVIQVPLGVGGGDSEMCINLAKAGGGKYSYVHDFYQLPRAIMNTMR